MVVARVGRRVIARFLAAGKAVVRTALAPQVDLPAGWTIKLTADALTKGRGLTFESSPTRRKYYLAGLVERQICVCHVEHALALAPHLLARVWRLERWVAIARPELRAQKAFEALGANPVAARERKDHRVLDISAHKATDCLVSNLGLAAQELRAHPIVEPGIEYLFNIPLSWACARQQQPRGVAFYFKHMHYRLLLLK